MAKQAADFKALFNALAVPYAVVNRKLQYVAVNDLVEEIVGRPRSDLIGECLLDLFPENPERQSMMQASFDTAFTGTAINMTEVPYALEVPGKAGSMRELWWTFHLHPLPSASGAIEHVGFHAQNITAEVHARELNQTIAEELRQRVKKTLSLVQVIARQTAPSYRDTGAFIDSFDDRIVSLAKTHDMLTGNNWDGVSFSVLLGALLEAHAALFDRRIFAEGPPLNLSATEAQALSMAIHELTANATRHGALSDRGGEIRITWQALANDGYSIHWTESGMAARDVLDGEGFGSAILNRILPAKISGKANHRFTADSHAYSIVVDKRRG